MRRPLGSLFDAFPKLAICSVVAAWSLGGGCVPTPAPSEGRLVVPVAVSVPPQAWLVEAVGGEHVDVVSVAGPQDSAETYQPTDAEVSRVLASRLYFRGGVPFERGAWFEALTSAPDLSVVDLRRDLVGGEGGLGLLAAPRGHEHGEGFRDTAPPDAVPGDPHLWLSPRRLAVQAGTVAEALAEVDPVRAPLYRENLRSVRADLAALDRELTARLAPYDGRAFYVFHPAWGYLAADYGLRQEAIEVEGKSPSDAELTRLQERALADGARVVFVQPQIPHRAADAVAEAVGARLQVLDPLARDVPANLRRTAEVLAAGFEAASVPTASREARP